MLDVFRRDKKAVSPPREPSAASNIRFHNLRIGRDSLLQRITPGFKLRADTPAAESRWLAAHGTQNDPINITKGPSQPSTRSEVAGT